VHLCTWLHLFLGLMFLFVRVSLSVCLCVCAFVLLILCFGEMQMYDIFPLPQPRFRLESLFSATMPPEALDIICSPVCLCLSVTVGVGVFVLSLC